MAMAGVTGVGDLAGGGVEGGEQAGDSVPGVVVSVPLGDARAQRQDRLGALQRLALGLLIHAQHHCVVGRVQVQADDVFDLVSSSGSVENLNPWVRCGARQNRRHTRMTESWLTGSWPLRRSQSASRRDDQCVIPCAWRDSGGGVSVAARIWHTASSVSTVTGPPPRGASSSPASPDAVCCRRHLITVGSVQPVRSAICGPVSPSAASSTIRALSATLPAPPGPWPGAAAPPGRHRAPSQCACDSAYAIVLHQERELKEDTRS